MACYGVVLLALCFSRASASSHALSANPIRKVVTLMQNMQAEVEAEMKKETELFDKFMCFCETTGTETANAIETGKAAVDSLTAKEKEESATKAQLEQEVVEHKTDREGAKADLAEATSLRQKESAEFAAFAADAETNIKGLAAAIPAIEKGMDGASFLQAPFGNRVKHMVESFPDMDPIDRRNAMAFFQGQEGEESAGSGEILGIMKQMKETMEANLKDATDTETTAATGFAELEASKLKEIEVATESIESKTLRSGELAVAVVQTKDELEDTKQEIADNEKMAAELKKQCASKAKAHEVSQKEKTDEISAISQAIGILNDDDALEIFKKAGASAAMVQTGVAFLQKSSRSASKAVKAETLLQSLALKKVPHKQELHLMLYTMKSKLRLANKHQSRDKTQKFDEIIKAVDEMVTVLANEQKDDDKQKEFCRDEFDKAEDEEVVAKDSAAKIAAEIEEQTDMLAQLTEEIKTLGESIAALDKAVVVATAQRKEEHEEQTAAAQMSQAAIELVGKAKGKLEKFYGGALVQEKADVVDSFVSFAQVRAHARMKDEADEDESEDQVSRKESGVISMMDGIIHDLEMDMKDGENAEKSAQEDYAKLMAESQETRTQDQKSISDKMAAKADGEAKIVEAKDAGAKADEALLLVKKQIADLHASCDFLLQNYDMRKEARATEIDSLKNAKAMLQGAVM